MLAPEASYSLEPRRPPRCYEDSSAGLGRRAWCDIKARKELILPRLIHVSVIMRYDETLYCENT